MSLEIMEKNKASFGEVTLIGLGRLGVRTALHLMEVHRGGPRKLTAIDGQRISADDLLFRSLGGKIGDFKVHFLENLAGEGFHKEICGIPINISKYHLDLISGDVICIEIAGGDTLPITAAIIQYAQERDAFTISTMGVFGIGEEEISSISIEDAEDDNPIVQTLRSYGIRNHLLVGTGKLIRDWEPVTPYVLDAVSYKMTAEILKFLEKKKCS